MSCQNQSDVLWGFVMIEIPEYSEDSEDLKNHVQAIGNGGASSTEAVKATMPSPESKVDRFFIKLRNISAGTREWHWAAKLGLALLGVTLALISFWQVFLLGSSFAFLSIACIGIAIEAFLIAGQFVDKDKSRKVDSKNEENKAKGAAEILEETLAEVKFSPDADAKSALEMLTNEEWQNAKGAKLCECIKQLRSATDEQKRKIKIKECFGEAVFNFIASSIIGNKIPDNATLADLCNGNGVLK